MKKLIIVALCCTFIFSCDKKTETAKAPANGADTVAKSAKPEKKFEMYEMSEMAALMEQMYVDNQRLKERIISGDTIGTFPEHILKMHSSAMTDPTENDAFFKEQAAKFIAAQRKIYADPKNAKQHFNDAVQSCVACHEQKCEGPIPRIKKLYIK
jgi:cytochrome c553